MLESAILMNENELRRFELIVMMPINRKSWYWWCCCCLGLSTIGDGDGDDGDDHDDHDGHCSLFCYRKFDPTLSPSSASPKRRSSYDGVNITPFLPSPCKGLLCEATL